MPVIQILGMLVSSHSDNFHINVGGLAREELACDALLLVQVLGLSLVSPLFVL